MLVLQLPALLCEPQDTAQTLSPSFVSGQATAAKDPKALTTWKQSG